MPGRVVVHTLVLTTSALALGACETFPPLEPDAWPSPDVAVRSRAAPAATLDPAALDDEALPDESVRAAVEERLRREPAVDPADVRVRVDEGVVTLSGTTTDLLTRDRVVDEASGVRGVRGVVNDLAVEPEARADEAIARDVRAALRSAAALEGRVLRVRVTDGYVSLEGALASAAEAEHAVALARAVRGVRDVVDRTAVAARDSAGDAEVRASLERTLALDGRFDDAPIGVEVKGGVATLTGTVDSAREREIAADHALAAGADFVDVRGLEVDGFEDEALRPGGQVEDDGLIEDAVRAALSRDPRLDDGAVRVEVRDGVATLHGTVRTLAARKEATARAREANGVRGVRNLVGVAPAADVADTELSARVEEALSRDPWLFESELTVLVDDGVVTLAGELPSRYARARAQALVSSIEGVDEVVTERVDVAAAPPASDEELRAAVLEQLFWNPDVDPADISVRVEGGVVWLGGEARDALAAASARESAFLAGARNVVNEIVVPTDRPDVRTTPRAEREYLGAEPLLFETPLTTNPR